MLNARTITSTKREINKMALGPNRSTLHVPTVGAGTSATGIAPRNHGSDDSSADLIDSVRRLSIEGTVPGRTGADNNNADDASAISTGTGISAERVEEVSSDPTPREREEEEEAAAAAADAIEMPSEVIVCIGTFFDVGRDLSNFCVAIGPQNASLVRHEYLLDNDAYLLYCLALRNWHLASKHSSTEQQEEDDDDADAADVDAVDEDDAAQEGDSCCIVSGDQNRSCTVLQDCRQRMVEWLGVNASTWKDRVLDTELRTERSTARPGRTAIAILIKTKQAKRIKFKKTIGGFIAFNGCIENFDRKLRKHKVGIKPGDIVTSINGKPIGLDMSPEDIDKMMSHEDKKYTVKFLLGEPSVKSIFTNPTMATALGLTDILETMVDACAVRINKRFIALSDNLETESFKVTMLYTALGSLKRWNNPAFAWLVARKDIDFSVKCSPFELGGNILHAAASGRLCCRDSPMQALIDSGARDLINSTDMNGYTPLHYVCDNPEIDIHVLGSRVLHAKLALLLNTGSDPNARCAAGVSARGMLMMWLHFLEHLHNAHQHLTEDVMNERRALIADMVALLESAGADDEDVDAAGIWDASVAGSDEVSGDDDDDESEDDGDDDDDDDDGDGDESEDESDVDE
mmetsp:Transcript_3250/g.7475  ORF Transcript_3250/g.7475 Transcript_3250/m.7475 type:complete len:632 (-) Transcript_3250:206-2101(-)